MCVQKTYSHLPSLSCSFSDRLWTCLFFFCLFFSRVRFFRLSWSFFFFLLSFFSIQSCLVVPYSLMFFFFVRFRCKLLSLDDLWYGSQAIKIQIKLEKNTHNITLYGKHSVCVHWNQCLHWQCLHCIALFCILPAHFVRSFVLNLKIIEYTHWRWYAFATCTTVPNSILRNRLEHTVHGDTQNRVHWRWIFHRERSRKTTHPFSPSEKWALNF